MSNRANTLAIIGTLAILAAAIVWPRLFLDAYGSATSFLTEPAEEGVMELISADEPQVRFSEIDFNLQKPPDGSSSSPPAPYEKSKIRRRLIIPAMGVDAEIIESPTQDALRYGMWHIPGSALPGQPGNTVITAHRWLYKPPSKKTFYRIDELKAGDRIYIEYGTKKFTYEAVEFRIVDPSEVGILSQDENKLTLFTCHPLFSTKQRYVVTAYLTDDETIE